MQLGRVQMHVGRAALFCVRKSDRIGLKIDTPQLAAELEEAMNAITVSDLSKEYQEHLALDHISFEVKEGELFAYLGENGAGKSTTINILSTVLKKSGGSVKVFDYELGKEDDEIRDAIGIVFQNSVLDNKLTVKENLYTRGAYYGLSGRQVDERLVPFMRSFELSEIWNRKYETLSGGQRRRVDIVRALLNDPKILFLDEPTTGLDPKSRKIVWDHINYLRREKNRTIFLTTHYMEETRDADQVVILDQGKIIAKGTPAELKSKYAHTRLIWYTDRSGEREEVINGYEFTYDSDHYNVMFQGNITDFLYQNKSRITDYEIVKGSMDDVFLNLTGKELV